jgi:polyphosphate kinase
MRALMTAELPATVYLNRDLSWLDFNERVLHEAEDERNPLLERLKFAAIVSSNLDEFYMIRVAGLRRQLAGGIVTESREGLTARQALDAIDVRVRALVRRQITIVDELLDLLRPAGVTVASLVELTPDELAEIRRRWEVDIFAVLTPLAVDPSHPFPHISNLSTSLAVEIRESKRSLPQFARVKVPKSLPRWLPTGVEGRFVPLEQVIGAYLSDLFPGTEILGWHAFRVTRHTDIDTLSVEEPDDVLAMIEEQVFRRRFGEVVRLEVQDGMPTHLRRLILDELRQEHGPEPLPLSDPVVHEAGTLLDLADLAGLAALDVPELRDPPFVPSIPPAFRGDSPSIFEVIAERDVLVHHPYESFAASVERFFETAAIDPEVLAIKTTLYRTSGDTAIVRALAEAARRGKQVAVAVELKARFDEENNIAWARMLERYGVHVVYGQAGLKIHAKMALVVRREGPNMRRYVHIGTGNYNSRTARIYTDFGLFTARPEIGEDVANLFNALTGYQGEREYARFLVSPNAMRSRFLALIDRETANAEAGREARVVAKMNAITDDVLIRALYGASESGVDIELIVRGICCLRPGVPGLSERIRVRSIIGRFLEHSRVWAFANGGSPEYYIGSADWMERNLDRRVETVVPIEDDIAKRQLQRLLDLMLADDRQAWELRSDGSWQQLSPKDGRSGTHALLLRDPWGSTVTA